MASYILEAPLHGGCLEACPAAYQVPRSPYSPTLITPPLVSLAIFKPRKAFTPQTHSAHSRQLHDSRKRGLCLARSASLVSSPRFLRHTWGSQGSMEKLRLAENTTNLSYQTPIPLLKHKPLVRTNSWPRANLAELKSCTSTRQYQVERHMRGDICLHHNTNHC